MNNVLNRIKVVYSHIKDNDFGYIFNGIKRRMFSTELSLGLKKDLSVPFKTPEAKINLSIRLIENGDAEYFDMTHFEDGLINENIPNCFVAVDENDVPCFRQWLMGSKQNDKIKSYFGGTFPCLEEDEALLEGAFIPPKNRGLGIMPAGICMVISKGIDANVRYVITFVEMHNIASLKGCARAGFLPYTLRTVKWFLFNKTVRFTDVPKDVLSQFSKDVMGKPKPLAKSLHLV